MSFERRINLKRWAPSRASEPVLASIERRALVSPEMGSGAEYADVTRNVTSGEAIVPSTGTTAIPANWKRAIPAILHFQCFHAGGPPGQAVKDDPPLLTNRSRSANPWQ